MGGLSLRAKLLGGTAGIVILLGLSLVFFVKTALSEKLFVKLQKRGISIARTIAVNSVNPILTERFFELEMMVKDFKSSEEDIRYIFIADEYDGILAHTFEGGFPVALKEANRVPAGKEYSARRLSTEDGKILDIAVPLLKGGIGAVHLGISEASVERDVNDIIRLITWIVVAVLVVGGGLTVGFSEALTRPILQLVAAAKAVGRGDLNHRITVNSRDEIGELGETFNTMIAMRRKAEEALQKSEDAYRSLVESTEDSIYLVDRDYRYLFINKRHLARLGSPAERFQGRHYGEFHSPEKTEEFIEGVDTVFRTGESFRQEHLSSRDNHYFLRTFSPVKDVGGKIVAVTVISKDVTELKHMQERLRALSLTDELTGLYNRRGFFALAEQAVRTARRQKIGLFILYADLDNLKGINDALGHQEGDRALADAAALFRTTYRESDIIARIGGDEFVIVLQGNTGDGESAIVRLQKNVVSHNEREDRNYSLSISIGISYYDPETPDSIDDLLARADRMLYEEKKKKRRL